MDKLDLTEAFYWVCSSDLRFSPTRDGDACVIQLNAKHGDPGTIFKILKKGMEFEVGQLIEYDVDPQEDTCTQVFRHPSLFVQENKLPANLPIHDHYIGPVKEMTMLRLMWLAQASLSNDREAVDYYRGVLKLSYDEIAQRAQSNGLTFPARYR